MIARETQAVDGRLDIPILFLILQKGLKLIKAVSTILAIRVEQDEDLASLFHLFDNLDGVLETRVEACSSHVIIFVRDSLKIRVFSIGF